MTKRFTIALVALTTLVLGVSACGGGDGGSTTTGAPAASTGESGGQTITVDLAEQNGSGESGTATLAAEGQKTKVTIQLSGGPSGTPQPAHIHDGTCAKLGDVRYALNNVVDGASEITVDASLSELMSVDYAINVHESEAKIQNYVACGDLPKG